jgi:hypothetical protein
VKGRLVPADPAEEMPPGRVLDRSRRGFVVGHRGWANDRFEPVTEDLFGDAVSVGMVGPKRPRDSGPTRSPTPTDPVTDIDEVSERQLRIVVPDDAAGVERFLQQLHISDAPADRGVGRPASAQLSVRDHRPHRLATLVAKAVG